MKDKAQLGINKIHEEIQGIIPRLRAHRRPFCSLSKRLIDSEQILNNWREETITVDQLLMLQVSLNLSHLISTIILEVETQQEEANNSRWEPLKGNL